MQEAIKRGWKKCRADAGCRAVQVQRGLKSILCISCRGLCLVYWLHRRQQQRKAVLFDIREATQRGEVPKRTLLLRSALVYLSLELFVTFHPEQLYQPAAVHMLFPNKTKQKKPQKNNIVWLYEANFRTTLELQRFINRK